MVLFFIISFLAILVLLVFILLIFLKIAEILSVDAPFVSIPQETVEYLVNNFRLTNNGTFYDLGCGDARIIRKVSELRPEMNVVGIEIAIIPYLLSKFFTRKHKNIKIRRENIFNTNISDANYIFMYLYPKTVNNLIRHIKNQCSPGTILMSCDFKIESCQPIKVVNIRNNHSRLCEKLFIYVL